MITKRSPQTLVFFKKGNMIKKATNKSKTYPKWVGVLLAFILPGSAHFISGQRVLGTLWCILIVLFGGLSIITLAIPFNMAIPLAIFCVIISLILWGWMLVQSYRDIRRIGFWGWVMVICITLSLNTFMRYMTKNLVDVFIIPASAMEPTLMGDRKDSEGRTIRGSGDRLVVEKISYYFYSPKRGDLAVFRSEKIAPYARGKFFIKRVVGLPGEKISIQPPYILINGKKLTEPLIFKKISEEMGGYLLAGRLNDTESEVVLGPDEYFLMGDNSKNSFDSRFFGPVLKDKFIGRAVRIIWPLNRMKILE